MITSDPKLVPTYHSSVDKPKLKAIIDAFEQGLYQSGITAEVLLLSITAWLKQYGIEFDSKEGFVSAPEDLQLGNIILTDLVDFSAKMIKYYDPKTLLLFNSFAHTQNYWKAAQAEPYAKIFQQIMDEIAIAFQTSNLPSKSPLASFPIEFSPLFQRPPRYEILLNALIEEYEKYAKEAEILDNEETKNQLRALKQLHYHTRENAAQCNSYQGVLSSQLENPGSELLLISRNLDDGVKGKSRGLRANGTSLQLFRLEKTTFGSPIISDIDFLNMAIVLRTDDQQEIGTIITTLNPEAKLNVNENEVIAQIRQYLREGTKINDLRPNGFRSHVQNGPLNHNGTTTVTTITRPFSLYDAKDTPKLTHRLANSQPISIIQTDLSQFRLKVETEDNVDDKKKKGRRSSLSTSQRSGLSNMMQVYSTLDNTVMPLRFSSEEDRNRLCDTLIAILCNAGKEPPKHRRRSSFFGFGGAETPTAAPTQTTGSSSTQQCNDDIFAGIQMAPATVPIAPPSLGLNVNVPMQIPMSVSPSTTISPSSQQQQERSLTINTTSSATQPPKYTPSGGVRTPLADLMMTAGDRKKRKSQEHQPAAMKRRSQDRNATIDGEKVVSLEAGGASAAAVQPRRALGTISSTRVNAQAERQISTPQTGKQIASFRSDPSKKPHATIKRATKPAPVETVTEDGEQDPNAGCNQS